MNRPQTEKCYNCDGHGLISDYGSFGLEFYGPKECKTCNGSGKVLKRDKLGRFTK